MDTDGQLLNIKVKTITGKCFQFQIDSNVSVLQFKEIIQAKSEIPVDNQKLIYLGKVLKDCQTVGSYEIKDSCCVHLVNAKCNKENLASTSYGDPVNTQATPMSPVIPSSTDTPMSDIPVLPPISAMTSGFPPTDPNPFVVQSPARNLLNPFSFLRMVRGCPSTNQQQVVPQGAGQEVPQIPPLKTPESKPAKYPCNMMRSRCQLQPDSTEPPQQGLCQNPPPPYSQPVPPSAPPPSSSLCVESDLDQAITRGSLEKVREAIGGGANVNRGGLHKACLFGHKEIALFLISKGAKLDLKLANGETCVHTCAFYGQKDILEQLLANCDVNVFERTNDGKTPLMLAVYNNHRSVVELLLRHGASVFDNDIHGATPLILAAQKGNKEIVELLLQNSARVDARDCRGRTALHFSASAGFPNILALLLQHGASVNAINCNRETALHYAAFHGKKECVQLLLNNAADPSIQSISGTAFQLAMCKGQHEVVELLQQHGCSFQC